ncbi:MAG TPA: nucleotidyltransferase domain-containing protein [Thermomicrobiales bacterium]|nr:nucleotidyltransferase domain-containing protein [Thermomicrobiales bacterium]
MSATTLANQLEARIRQELPSLTIDESEELARVLDILVQIFRPKIAYVFGSQARGDTTADSDVDLMLVVTSSDEPSYRRAQAAYRAINSHFLPIDILIWTREEFDRRRPNSATLPGTIVREGKVLYATAIPG